MHSKMVSIYILGQVVSLLSAGVALFWSAGRLNWWPAWAALGVWAVWFLVTDLILIRTNPALMAERLSPPRDAKTWDRVLLSTFRLLTLARYILAGLDHRYGWTGDFPLAAQLAGLVVSALSYGLLGWAMASNSFFSQVVRIQSDRGQTVVSAGPYRFIRHPGYIGMILFEPALSTLLGSWAAIITGVVCSLLVIARTAREDQTLQADLSGYAEYARQVRYRLLPGIW